LQRHGNAQSAAIYDGGGGTVAKFDFNIGSPVHCKDGDCGKLLKVVVDPDTETITDLVVQKGILLTTDRIVPVSVVEKTTEEEIHLSIVSDQLEQYPEYHEDEITVPAPGWERAEQRKAEEATQRASLYGQAFERAFVPRVRHRIHKGISPGRSVVERGMPVNNLEKTIGKVDHLLVDRESLEITHLVVDPGLLARSLVVPISMVKQISEDGVYVEATDQDLEPLPRHIPRHEADVLTDLQERLVATSFDFDDVKATFNNGVLQLRGVVPDVQAKRQAEAIARSLEGVIDVENALTTDTSIVAHITSALSTDPRTDVAIVGVINERGVVSLKGQVDDPNTREAAEKIARRQPGVVDVINDLEVKIDDVTELLRFRTMLLEQETRNPRRGLDRIDN
jgi:osmotically-inducible protein OsmY